jgi:polygalacturonase
MMPVPARLSRRTLRVLKSLVFVCVTLAMAQQLQANPPTLPTIPPGTFYVTNFGAIGDNLTTNTMAIQNTINAAGAAGGGTVDISPGIFISGPLFLTNSVNLLLESGATLRALPRGRYPGGTSPSPFISATNLHDLEITGAGSIDGQGNSGWWTNNLSTSQRPVLVFFSKCNAILVQNVTVSNAPVMHVVFKSTTGDVTIDGITISSPGTSPNTDGIDLIGTNCLVENCSISAGDDNIALGSTGGTSSDTVVTNCTFGTGHGLSIGSNTSGGVSNLTVYACSFNGTQYGIRLKSDNSSSSGGSGGLAENLAYYNLTMANITFAPIVIYSYYNEVGTPISITPSNAASQTIPFPVPATTAIWRNITISNLTANTIGGIAGIIWGRLEMPVTNVVLDHVKITGAASFDAYNVSGLQFIDSQITVPARSNTFEIYGAGITLSNRSTQTGTVTIDGLTSTNSLTNSLALYSASASATATDILGANPVSISAGTLTVSNSLLLPTADTFNFALGSNASTVAARGNLALNGAVINITNANGFGPGTYTVFTYTGSLSGNAVLGNAPTNFNYAINTNTLGQVQVTVTQPGPSLAPFSMTFQTVGTNLQLSWPADHIGFQLELQTNKLSDTNWIIVPGGNQTNLMLLPIIPHISNTFFRLAYPQ